MAFLVNQPDGLTLPTSVLMFHFILFEKLIKKQAEVSPYLNHVLIYSPMLHH